MDTVDTPFWPYVNDFVKPDRTIPWRDLQHDIFRIAQTYDLGKGKFGPSVVPIRLFCLLYIPGWH